MSKLEDAYSDICTICKQIITDEQMSFTDDRGAKQHTFCEDCCTMLQAANRVLLEGIGLQIKKDERLRVALRRLIDEAERVCISERYEWRPLVHLEYAIEQAKAAQRHPKEDNNDAR
jgi:hypothetical protein